MIVVRKNEATAARRRVYFHLVDASDGMTPETGEAAGQPQISVDGAAWTNVGIGTLVAIGNGRYYAELTQAIVNADDAVIETRYKSAATAECPGSTVQVLAEVATIAAQGATGSGLSAVPWNTAWDAEVQRECTDALVAVSADVAAVKADTGAIKTITDTLTGAAVTVISPVADSGTLTIYQGDDYATAEGRAITFTITDAAHLLLLDTATSIKLKMHQVAITGTAVSTAEGYTVTFQPTVAQTALITMAQPYEVEAVLANTHVVTLATGNVVVVRNIPEVV